jgi:hypothetical protein
MKRIVLSGLAALLLISTAAAASVPSTLSHQGRLTTADGETIDADMRAVFTIYGSPDGDDVLWQETQELEIRRSWFTVQLGALIPFGDTFRDGGARWMGVAIDGDDEMVPRSPVSSVPYALVADDAVGDIHPRTISVNGSMVVDAQGRWVGSPAGLQGPMGPAGPAGGDGEGRDGLRGAGGCSVHQRWRTDRLDRRRQHRLQWRERVGRTGRTARTGRTRRTDRRGRRVGGADLGGRRRQLPAWWRERP